VKNYPDRLRRLFLIALILTGAFVVSSCHRSGPPGAKRYPFTGRVVSIDVPAESVLIDGDNIPGFMDPMAMSYKIKPATTLKQLAPGDSIAAEVVVVASDPKNPDAAPDYWLENVKVTAHAAPAPAANAPHLPAPGDAVPNFSFTNQNGKHISLKQYAGKVLLVTFIYTRCPFPDFCPRMSSNFAVAHKQLAANPNVHLLSLSFDPEHDTPKVLRDYGFSVAHTHDPALFTRWEFAAPGAADLPKIADFFALTVKPEGGLITHTLSTTVIGPDGKIVRWYHGSDWQVSDLIKDATAASIRRELRNEKGTTSVVP
jgi:protein SCO1